MRKSKMIRTEERHRNHIPVAVSMVLSELEKAIKKHPAYPADIIHASAIIAEESGELTRECLRLVYESDGIPYVDLQKMALREECIQTACTAIRMLIHLEEDGDIMYAASTPELVERTTAKREPLWKRVYHAIRSAI
jgi:hypothetical protein